MAIWGYIFNKLTASIIVSFAVMFSTPFVYNYQIIQKGVHFAIPICMLIIAGISMGLSSMISMLTGYLECSQVNFKYTVVAALKQSSIMVFVYFILLMVGLFKSPFIDIGGDTVMWNSIAEGFYLGMSTIALTIVNYFQSQIKSCQVTHAQAEKNYGLIHRELNNKPKKKKTCKVNPVG